MEDALELTGGRTFKVEGAACANVLGWMGAWNIGEEEEGLRVWSPRVRGRVGWDGAREAGRSKTVVGHGEESGFYSGDDSPGKDTGG